MSSLYFNKNISINQRSKRLRHVTSISAKNLQIKANKYNIWITFHSSRSSNAFYITDKSYNELKSNKSAKYTSGRYKKLSKDFSEINRN